MGSRLYSKQLILPGEDPAEFDELRASLRREHQPANTTEEILVDDLAQSFWRMRRFRELEAHAWSPALLSASIDNGMMTLIVRSMASAERSFHKTLTALSKLQKCTGREPAPPIESRMSPRFVSETKTQRVDSADLGAGHESVVRDQEKTRGFVPQNPVKEETTAEETGFVPTESPVDAAQSPTPAGFVPQKTGAELEAFEYFGYFPEDAEQYVESILDSGDHLPENIKNAA